MWYDELSGEHLENRIYKPNHDNEREIPLSVSYLLSH